MAARIESTMSTAKNIEQLIGLSLFVLLIIGSYLVLRPFLSALLWAALLCYATWPLFLRLNRGLGDRRSWAAMVLCLAIAVVVVAPFIVVGLSLADNVTRLNTALHALVAHGLPPPPNWIGELPLVGTKLQTAWLATANDMSTLLEPLQRNLPEVSKWLLGRSVALGNGVLQLSLSVFILFFLYRDGAALAQRLDNGLMRIGGDHARALLRLAGNTVKGVVYGILGTAIMQGILAAIGFLIAGVPGALVLGLATFFLSVVPMGPPLIWIPVAAWLYYQGQIGWAIFLVVWGIAVVSSIDNFLKPYLISQGAAMPFVLVLLGVLGGLVAFGFVGVFLGPTLLAVGYSLVRDWTLNPASDTPVQS
jgi:predicted PurR-regulated permease PerM